MNCAVQTIESIRRRRGFTLFELIASLAAASVLMIGLSSSLYIAVQAVDVSDSPSAAVLEGQAVLVDMHADLQYALTASETAANAITVTIPDRDDADTSPETIRYAWSGTVGDPLTRQFNGGVAVVVAPNVNDLKLDYWPATNAVDYIKIELRLANDPNTLLLTTIELVNRP